jgi:hypothetical protein
VVNPLSGLAAHLAAERIPNQNQGKEHGYFSTGAQKESGMVIPIIVGFVFLAIGIAIFIYGIVFIMKRRKQNANSLSTDGVVIGFAREMGRSGYLYYPQVEFRLATGQVIRFQSSVGSSRAEYGVGQPVKVLYTAYHPQEAEIEAVTSMWLLPGCMVGMGIIFIIIGFILSVLMILVALKQP